MALIDLAPRFHTAVRGYDRTAVDAAMRAESEHLDRLNARIQVLEQALVEVHAAQSVDRSAQFRNDDPERRRAMRAVADMVVDAWDHARQVVVAEDATADLQRKHAAAIAAANLADVTARAKAQEQHAQQTADSWLAAATAEAARMRAQAEDFIADAHPMAERILAEAAEEAHEIAHRAEAALHAAREAMDADLMRRQTAAEYALAESVKLAERLQGETASMNAEVARVQEATLAEAHAAATELVGALDLELGRLEAEADQAMAQLADHMAAMSTQVTVARETMAARPARASRAAAAAEAAPAKAPKARAPRKPKAEPATPAEVEETAPVEAAARIAAPAAPRPTIKIARAAPSIIRL